MYLIYFYRIRKVIHSNTMLGNNLKIYLKSDNYIFCIDVNIFYFFKFVSLHYM